MSKTVLITGASGYIGRHLQQRLAEKGYAIRTLTTQKINSNVEDCFYWNPETGEVNKKAFESVDYIIHLAGASIGTHRWTEQRKKLIRESRVKSTELLFTKINLYKIPLKAFITASATGYYGSVTSDIIFDEESPAADDFLGNVCYDWEKTADLFSNAGIRTVKIRTGVVFSKDAPALKKILLPVKLGIGSPLGTGRQYMPWIHIEDLCNIYLRAIEDEGFSGAYNAVAPQQITNREMMKTLAKIHHKPFWVPPVPAFVFKMMLGEMAVIILKGSRVVPKRLIEEGFLFQYTDITKLILS